MHLKVIIYGFTYFFMYDIYLKYSAESFSNSFILPKGYFVKKTSSVQSLHDLLWHFESFFFEEKSKFTRWELYNADGLLLSVDHTIGPIIQFPFMKKGEIHLGPGETPVVLRGNGYHTLLIKYILNQFNGYNIYSIVSNDNAKSLNVLHKIGFKDVAYGHTTIFRRHVIDMYFDDNAF